MYTVKAIKSLNSSYTPVELEVELFERFCFSKISVTVNCESGDLYSDKMGREVQGPENSIDCK